MASAEKRSGAAGLGILVGVVVMVILFLFSGGFFRSSGDLLRESLELKAFEKKYPGLERAGTLGPAQRAELAEALAPALQDRDPRTRLHAGLALAKLGTGARAALPRLIAAARDTDPEVRRGAVAALEAAAGLNVPYAVRGALSREALEWRARKALIAIGGPEAGAAAISYRGACPAAFRSGGLNWCD